MTRYKAFLIHLLGSAGLLGLIFLLISQVWYPGKLFSAAAGINLLAIIICVDMIIGPVVMLIIFDAKKKYIKLDVVIVLLVQLSFMGYGFWSMFVARPAYLAFVENRFYMVRADEIDTKDLASAKDFQFKNIPKLGPVYVGTKEPSDQKIKNDILFGELVGMGLQNLPQYFVPYQSVRQQVIAAGRTSQHMVVDLETRHRLKLYEKKMAPRSILFLNMINKTAPMIVVIDAKTAEVIELI